MNKNKLNINRFFTLVMYGILYWILIGYILLPLFNTFMEVVFINDVFTLDIIIKYFSNENNIKVILNTLKLGLGSVVICGALGTILALYMTFLCKKKKKILHIILLTPMMIPGVILVIACIQLYGESGMFTKVVEMIPFIEKAPYEFSGLGAILFVIAYTQYVYFYLNVYVALKYVDYSTLEAAKGMGASKLRIFKDVVWPVVAPSVITSVIVTFASGISAFSAPNLIGGGYKVLSTQIVRSKSNNFMEVASLQVVILLLMGIVFMLTVQYYGKRYGVVTSTRASSIDNDNIKKGAFYYICNMFVGIQVILIVLPILTIVYLSFVSTHSIMMDIFPRDFTMENYKAIIEQSRVIEPMINSITMSVLAIFIGLIITVPVSYMVIKKNNRLNRLSKFIIMLPWSMPASAIAINLINSFNKENIFAFNNILVGGFYILPIAYAITAFPLLYSSNEIAIKSINPAIEEASWSLGADKKNTFLRIVVPNMMPGIISGAILVFIRTIGEYTVSALLYGVYNRPISISIVTNMQEYKTGISMAYGVIVIIICCISLFAVFKVDKDRFI